MKFRKKIDFFHLYYNFIQLVRDVYCTLFIWWNKREMVFDRNERNCFRCSKYIIKIKYSNLYDSEIDYQFMDVIIEMFSKDKIHSLGWFYCADMSKSWGMGRSICEYFYDLHCSQEISWDEFIVNSHRGRVLKSIL